MKGVDTLRRNSAKYHNCKLERARKRAAEMQKDPGEGHSEVRRTSFEVEKCFLREPQSELQQAMTM